MGGIGYELITYEIIGKTYKIYAPKYDETVVFIIRIL